MNCINCGTELVQLPQKRVKRFCDSTCRSNYWQKAQRKIKVNNMPENKKRILEERNTVLDHSKHETSLLEIPTVDNSEIEKQIAAIRNEIKPSFVDKSRFEKYQEKKIAELKKLLK